MTGNTKLKIFISNKAIVALLITRMQHCRRFPPAQAQEYFCTGFRGQKQDLSLIYLFTMGKPISGNHTKSCNIKTFSFAAIHWLSFYRRYWIIKPDRLICPADPFFPLTGAFCGVNRRSHPLRQRLLLLQQAIGQRVKRQRHRF